MKYLFFFIFFFLYVSGLLAQVPLGQEQAVEDQNAVAMPQQEDSLPAIFSDPSEIEMIEGLDEPLERVKLRDQDTNLILDMIQAITGRYILRPQNLPQVKINFDSMNVLTKRETLLALESLLAMNGIGITKIDSQFFKAVPATGMNAHVPIWLDGPATALPPSQRVYTKLFYLNYAPALEVREQVNPFATPNVSSLIVFEKANSLMITDSLLNIQRVEKIIESIDRPITKNELGTVIETYSCKSIGSEELKKQMDGMLEKSLKPFLGGTTAIESDSRTNKVLVITKKENWPMLLELFEELDTEVRLKTTHKLFKLQHGDAEDVHRILQEIITGQQKVAEEIAPGKSKPGSQISKSQEAASVNESGSLSQGSASSVWTGEKVVRRGSNVLGEDEGVEFSPLVSISVVTKTNSILAYGLPSDLALLSEMIDDLDEPLPLARIDTIFVMVDLSQQRQRGIDALFSDIEWTDDEKVETQQITNPGEDGDITTVGDNFTETITTSSGSNVLDGVLKVPGLNSAVPFQMQNWKLKQIQWEQIFSVASERNDVRIFSTPSIMVSHNAEAVHIKIEDERSVVIPTYAGNLNTTETSNTGQREKITASTELEIKKPKIGLSVLNEQNQSVPGSIFMEVKVKAEKFDETQANEYQGQSLPGKKVREALSHVSILDGEILVLGGLQEVQLDTTKTRYNLLSDIPYFGEKFFTPESTKYTPTELLIFLRPTIIDPKKKEVELTSTLSEKELIQNTFNQENSDTIDQMIDKQYTPVFRSPSGKLLGISDEFEDTRSEQDKKAPQPNLVLE
jgi:general secretion pathway protein D